MTSRACGCFSRLRHSYSSLHSLLPSSRGDSGVMWFPELGFERDVSATPSLFVHRRLSVCLSVCERDNSKTYGWILMKFTEMANYESERSWLNFGRFAPPCFLFQSDLDRAMFGHLGYQVMFHAHLTLFWSFTHGNLTAIVQWKVDELGLLLPAYLLQGPPLLALFPANVQVVPTQRRT